MLAPVDTVAEKLVGDQTVAELGPTMARPVTASFAIVTGTVMEAVLTGLVAVTTAT